MQFLKSATVRYKTLFAWRTALCYMHRLLCIWSCLCVTQTANVQCFHATLKMHIWVWLFWVWASPPPLPLFYIGEVRQFIAHRSCSHKLQGQPLLSYVTPQKSPKTLYFSCPSIVFPASTKYCENKFFIVIHPNKSISELGRYKS